MPHLRSDIASHRVRTIFVALLVIGVAASVEAERSRWEHLGTREIDGRVDHDKIVHHTDAVREFAYDAHPPATGTLVTALAAAPARGWTVVDMKSDWARIFKN